MGMRVTQVYICEMDCGGFTPSAEQLYCSEECEEEAGREQLRMWHSYNTEEPVGRLAPLS